MIRLNYIPSDKDLDQLSRDKVKAETVLKNMGKIRHSTDVEGIPAQGENRAGQTSVLHDKNDMPELKGWNYTTGVGLGMTTPRCVNKAASLKSLQGNQDLVRTALQQGQNQIPNQYVDPSTGQQVMLTPKQRRAMFDHYYIWDNPEKARKERFRHPNQLQNTAGGHAVRYAKGWFNPYKNPVEGIIQSGPLPGAFMGAGSGALAGYLGAGAFNMFRGPRRQFSKRKAALIGAVLNAALQGYRGYRHKQNRNNANLYKQSSFLNPKQEILKILASSDELNTTARMKAESAVRSMPNNAAQELWDFINSRSIFGGAAGILIMKYLMKKGFLSSVLGGGLLGAALARSLPTQDSGRMDVTGRAINF